MGATLRIYIRDHVSPGLETLEHSVREAADATGLDATDLLRSIAAVRQRIAADKPSLLRDVGRRVLDHAHQAFLVKSNGGTGEDGIRWKPLTTRYLRQRKSGAAIGIRSGELKDPRFDVLDVHTIDEFVQVGFGNQPLANFFNESRPLMPDRLPEPWYREATQTVQQRLDAAAEGLSR